MNKKSGKPLVRENLIRVNPRVYPRKSASTTGFSLVEIIIVITLLAIVGTIGMTFFTGTQSDTDLTSNTEKVIAALREAQTRSMSGEQTSTWGVHFDTDVATSNFFSVFHGASYTTATVTTPTHLPFNTRFSNIALNGVTTAPYDIKFDRLTGKTSQYGTGTSNQALCLTTSQESSACKKSIRVTPVGRIDWQ